MASDNNKPPVMKSIIGITIATGLGAALAAAGSSGGQMLGTLPAFAALAIIAYGIQWLVFVPAFVTQSERFYDLTGSITYLSVALIAASVKGDLHSQLLAALIAVWALRLGSFLFSPDQREVAMQEAMPHVTQTRQRLGKRAKEESLSTEN